MANSLFWIPVALYLAGWLGEALRYWKRPGGRLRWAPGVLGVGWGAHTLLVVALAVQRGPDLGVLLVGAAWLSLGGYYALAYRQPGAAYAFVLPPFAIALLITASFATERALLGAEGLGLGPAAQRNVLTAHIVAVVAGTVLFGLACLASIIYLVQERRLKTNLRSLAESRVPALGTLEGYNHQAITLGFFFLSVGLLLGLIVAGMENAAERLFTPRQLIPVGVWIVYAVFLVAHDLRGRRGRFGAIWSIVGFAVVVTSLVFEIVVLSGRA